MGIPPRFGIPSDTIFGADCGLVMGELRDRRKCRPRRAADGIPGPGSGVRHRRFERVDTHRPDDGRARHRAVMWLHGQACPQAGGACRRLCGGPQHVAAGPGRHFAAHGDRRDRPGGHVFRWRPRFYPRAGCPRAGRSREATAALSLWGGLRDAGLCRERLAGRRSGRREPGLRAHRAARAQARRPTGADSLARRQQACPWPSGRLTATLCGNSIVQHMRDGCAKRLSGHGATL